jgi:hypothetical protein
VSTASAILKPRCGFAGGVYAAATCVLEINGSSSEPEPRPPGDFFLPRWRTPAAESDMVDFAKWFTTVVGVWEVAGGGL